MAELRRLAPTYADLRRLPPTCADLRGLARTCEDLRRLTPICADQEFFFYATDQSCCVFSIHIRAFIDPDHRKIFLSLYLDLTETTKGG
jgi:hypothetical protein